MNRRLLLALSAAVVVIVAAVVVVLVTRDDDGDSPAATTLADEQRALLDSAVVSPDCPDEPAAAPDDDSLVALDVLRVDENDCLVATTEYLPAGEVEARRAELLAEDGVVAAGVVAEVSLDKKDDRRGDQWTLDRLGAEKGSPDLPWPDGHGAVLAVLDTGVDETHPDLGDAVVERRHYPGEGEHDPDGHGTHVTGIAAARRDNGGIVGVAPRVSVLDVPVRLKQANDKGPSWPTGLVWAVNHGADAVNMSFGGPRPADPDVEQTQDMEVEAAAVYFAVSNDVVVVSSGGNCGPSVLTDCDEDNQRELPASLDGVIAVGAVQKDFDLAGYSTRNEDIDIVAPGGGDVLTAVLSTYPGGDYEKLQGTSQAAPHVAAAAALIRGAAPESSGEAIAQALLDTADLDPLNEKDREGPGVGHGFLNITGALEQVLGDAPPTAAPADPTHALVTLDDGLYELDGDQLRRIRPADPMRPLRWAQWSADRSMVVGADELTIFSWSAETEQIVDVDCEWCSAGRPAYVDAVSVDGEPARDLVFSLDYSGVLTWYDAATLEQGGTLTAAFPADAVGTKTLLGAVGPNLLVHESGGAHASERVWLLDPSTGSAEVSHEVMGMAQTPVAVSADGEQVALATGYAACLPDNPVAVLSGTDLSELALAPTAPDGLGVEELFFNGSALYATFGSDDCSTPAGLWRLNRDVWVPVSADTGAARPFQGLPGDVTSSWLALVPSGGAAFQPPLSDDPRGGALDTATGIPFAVPTDDEVPWP